MLWESILVTFVALGICVATVPIISAGAELYFNQIAISQVSAESSSLFGEEFLELENSDEQERIALTVTSDTLIMTSGVTIILIVVSTVLAIIPMVRLKPREIFVRLS